MIDVATGIEVTATDSCTTGSSDQDRVFSRLALRPTGTVAWTGPDGVFAAPYTADPTLVTERRIGGAYRLAKQTMRTSTRGFCWRADERLRCRRVR